MLTTKVKVRHAAGKELSRRNQMACRKEGGEVQSRLIVFPDLVDIAWMTSSQGIHESTCLSIRGSKAKDTELTQRPYMTKETILLNTCIDMNLSTARLRLAFL